MVKNELIHPKNLQKDFLPYHFYRLTLEFEKGAFGKKLPVVAAQNPTVGIERRFTQVFYTSYSYFPSVYIFVLGSRLFF